MAEKDIYEIGNSYRLRNIRPSDRRIKDEVNEMINNDPKFIPLPNNDASDNNFTIDSLSLDEINEIISHMIKNKELHNGDIFLLMYKPESYIPYRLEQSDDDEFYLEMLIEEETMLENALEGETYTETELHSEYYILYSTLSEPEPEPKPEPEPSMSTADKVNISSFDLTLGKDTKFCLWGGSKRGSYGNAYCGTVDEGNDMVLDITEDNAKGNLTDNNEQYPTQIDNRNRDPLHDMKTKIESNIDGDGKTLGAYAGHGNFYNLDAIITGSMSGNACVSNMLQYLTTIYNPNAPSDELLKNQSNKFNCPAQCDKGNEP